MQADLNGDGEVDFEEFMKHFTNILNTIQQQRSLQNNYLSYMKDQVNAKKYGGQENLEDIGNLAKQELEALE